MNPSNKNAYSSHIQSKSVCTDLTNIRETSQENITATASRQYHSSDIHQQLGWDDFQAVSWSYKGPMNVVSGKKHPDHSTTHTCTWEVELPCRVQGWGKHLNACA